MPTKYKRIAVVVDPELSAALSAAGRQIGHRSQASLLRDLALRGAEQIRQVNKSPIDELLAIPGVRPGKSDLRGFLRENPLGPVPSDEPYGLSEALDEQREESL